MGGAGGGGGIVGHREFCLAVMSVRYLLDLQQRCQASILCTVWRLEQRGGVKGLGLRAISLRRVQKEKGPR